MLSFSLVKVLCVALQKNTVVSEVGLDHLVIIPSFFLLFDLDSHLWCFFASTGSILLPIPYFFSFPLKYNLKSIYNTSFSQKITFSPLIRIQLTFLSATHLYRHCNNLLCTLGVSSLPFRPLIFLPLSISLKIYLLLFHMKFLLFYFIMYIAFKINCLSF